MSNPEKTTGISTEERRLRSARLKSRLMGLCEGFDAGASVDVKAQEEEISRLEQQLDAANQRIAELESPLPDRIARKKAIYIGAPACFALEQAARHVNEAFGVQASYVVGSALTMPGWRDIDVRLILDDDDFTAMFPSAGPHWENDARWLLLIVSISGWMSKVTGLPIDFQIQPQTHANERHKGSRSAIGLRIASGGEKR